MSRAMAKPTQCVCGQQGSRPACASTQSDQKPCCSLRVSLLVIEFVGAKMSERFLTDEELAKACHEPDDSTKEFIMQQTMYRIKDPKRSLEFYTNVLGMRLLQRFDFPPMKFSLYFMGYEKAEDIPCDSQERVKWTFTRPATIELTHNWGTEKEDGEPYHNGNSDPRGFGHIGLSVPDVYKACERFEKMGVKFIKTPDGGKMKGLAFIQDPDGYWIEILSANNMARDVKA